MFSHDRQEGDRHCSAIASRRGQHQEGDRSIKKGTGIVQPLRKASFMFYAWPLFYGPFFMAPFFPGPFFIAPFLSSGSMPSRGISGLTAKPHAPTLFQIVSLVRLNPDLSQSSSDTSHDDPTVSGMDGDRVCPTVESRYVLRHFHFLRMNQALRSLWQGRLTGQHRATLSEQNGSGR